MRKHVITAALAGAAAFMLTTTAPATAVLDGTTDTDGLFPAVGGLQLQFEGEWYGFCSGTLVAPDVVLTAAHCTGPAQFGLDEWRISFDAEPDESSTYYYVDTFVVHPDWSTTTPGPGRGNSKQSWLKEGAEDVALVYLTEEVADIDPAPMADADYWEELDPADETFTLVGYGIDEYITGSVASPTAIVLEDGARSYRDVTLITTQDLFPDRFFKITQAACFGDSGGPLFHDGTVVAVISWTSSMRCAGPGLHYRLDSEQAQSFLGANGF